MYYSRFLTQKKYLGVKNIIWAQKIFIGCIYLLGMFIYSVWEILLCNKYFTQLDKTTRSQLAPWLSVDSDTHLSTSPTNCHLSTHATWLLSILEQAHSLVLSVPHTVHKGISVYLFCDGMGTLTEVLERYLRGKANVHVLLDTELTSLWPLGSEFPYLLSCISN